MKSASSQINKKLLWYLHVPEMYSFWAFLLIAIVLGFTGVVYFPFPWGGVSILALVIVGALIFNTTAQLASANKETKATAYNLESVVAHLRDGIVAYDNDFVILVFNTAAEQIFDIKKEEVVGKRFGPERVQEPRFRLLTQAIFPSLAPILVRRSEAGVYPQVVDVSFSDSTVELRVFTDRITNANGVVIGFMKVIRDRTRELQMSRSKSEFVAIAAHQLRGPATAASWTFETLLGGQSLSDEERQLVKNGLTESTRLLKIINDLLNVSKIEEGKFGYEFSNVNIIDFVGQVLEGFQFIARQYGVKLYFDRGQESAIAASVDPSKLELALSNFVENAILYNVKNGSVTVRVKRLTDKPYAQISVEDTGIGIPPEAMSKLFTKFFRAENARRVRSEGTGLGLYIAKNIIARHGGSIQVESVVNRGTAFYLLLPTDPRLIPPKEVVYEE